MNATLNARIGLLAAIADEKSGEATVDWHGLGIAAYGPGVVPNVQLHAVPVTMQVRLTAKK